MESGGLTYLYVSIVYHINWCTCAYIQHPIPGVLPQESFNNAQNEGVYTTQVQMSMSTVPMQQVWP